ncbi:phosphorothioated DNA-binding restriction endonuclease [Streptomyces sp. NPDC048172]|uniref:phosphorothioated DNA-binding restriction endonuclease n=1 Tax=Streptomyces sp. NPDC048172 TaxID=3365505 RepID=UPI00371F898E
MDWIERAGRLKRWTRDDERAPHKPLLMLYALGRFQQDPDGALRYSDVERDLHGLLREYGPPRATTPAYPFHHLANDGVWEVRTDDGGGSPGPKVGALRESGAAGRLVPELRDALTREPDLLGQLAHTLLGLHFPPSLHADLALDAGLDLETADAPRGVPREVRDRRRAAETRRRVLAAYAYRCAFCGFDGKLGKRPVGLEAAHVKWWAFRGPDAVANGLCLCALHHRLFDNGALGLGPGPGPERRILVSDAFGGTGAAARTQVRELHGREVAAPEDGSEPVAEPYADWHRREVFKGGGRKSLTLT